MPSIVKQQQVTFLQGNMQTLREVVLMLVKETVMLMTE